MARRIPGSDAAVAPNVGSPDVADASPFPGFDSALINLHALWNEIGSDPEALAAKLPERANWHPFFANWVKRCRRDPRVWTDGWRRDIQLRRDRRAVRDALIEALEEAGALGARTEGSSPGDR